MRINSIYIIILNYKSYQDTINYVDNLQKQEDVNLNILIVDNCSSNGSFNILNNTFMNVENVKVIKSNWNGGYAYGNNFGLRYLKDVKVDYILISNNDISINDNHLLYKLINEYNKLENPAFVSPIMLIHGKVTKYIARKMPTLRNDILGSLRIFEMIFGFKSSYKIEDNNSIRIKVDCVPGSFFIGKKEIFFNVGLFDENTFLYNEEAILAFKVKSINLNNYIITSLQFEHATSKTVTNEFNASNLRSYYVESRLYFHEKYLQTSRSGILLLKFFYNIWKVETFLSMIVSKILQRKRNQV